MLSDFLLSIRFMLLIATLIFGSRVQAETPFSGALSIELENGVTRKGRYDDKVAVPHNFTLDLICENGVWRKDVWGFGQSFSRASHHGEITESKWEGETLRLAVKMTMNRDALNEDVEGNYSIELKRDGAAMEGAYSGVYHEAPIKGAAHARIHPLHAKIPGVEEVKSGEHPRLVFRKIDLPKLKAAAKTPAGQAILAQLQARLNAPSGPRDKAYHAAGHGLLYLLNDDPQQAEAAFQINEAALRDDFCTSRFLSADALIGVALAYDFCYDAWTPEYRGMVASFIEDRASYMLAITGDTAQRQGIQPNLSDFEVFVGSDWQGVVRGAAAIAALSILHDPAPPLAAATDEPKLKMIEAIPNLDLGRGVPVSKFESDIVPVNWIFAGPFTPPDRNAWGPDAPPGGSKEPLDYLQNIGGHTGARADVGTRVRAFGMARDFAVLPSRVVSLAKSSKEKNIVDVCAAVSDWPSLDKDRPSVAYYYTVIDNDTPRAVQVATHNWNYVPQMALWLSGQPIKHNEYVRLAAGKHTLLVRVALASHNQPAWIAPRFSELTEEEAQQAERGVVWTWQEKQKNLAAIGPTFERVQENETIAEEALRRFLAMGINDCAEEANPGIAGALSQSVLPFLTAYRNVHGEDFATGTSAETVLPYLMTQVQSPAFGKEQPVREIRAVSHNAEIFSLGIGIVSRPELKDPARWVFSCLWGMGGDKSFAINLPHHAAYALANLARDTDPAQPAALSNAFEDAQQNVFVFRNQFKNADDIIATVNLAAFRTRKLARDSAAPPFYRLAGLGGRWQLREARERDDRTDDAMAFLKSAFVPKPDGSGVLTALSEITQPKTVRKTFAADYSGSSGVPALFVIAQKNSSRLNWTLDASANYAVNIGTADRSFTVAAPSGATLQGTLVGSVARLATRGLSNTLDVTGPSDCVLVLTLQKGPAPEVKVEGAGADQKIVVGGQTINFDGENFIFAK